MSEIYTARATRGAGWWTLIVDDVDGHQAATQVRRLDQAPAMVADLLATLLGGAPEDYAVRVVPVLDDEVREEVEEARTKRARIDVAIREAGEASRKAARHLAAQGLTARDIAQLLGISHQRVSQLLSS